VLRAQPLDDLQPALPDSGVSWRRGLVHVIIWKCVISILEGPQLDYILDR
jgi:hypothetical protein